MGSMVLTDASLPAANDQVGLRVEVLDALMKAKHCRSQAEHARRFGINSGYYSQIRSGKKTPSLQTALRMASVAGTSVEAIFGWVS
jgi:DNA-binding XRE family transcriptional regulator